jgi:uncharacterized protein (TIGR02466 family)
MIVENIFVSTVAVDMIDIDNESIKQFCYDLRQQQDVTSIYSNYGGWHSEPLTGHIPALNELFFNVSLRLNALHEYFNFRDDLKLSIDNCWVNINNKGHFNQPHTHREWTFSGVYYVTGHEDCGDLVLVHPSQQFPYHYREQPFKEHSIERSMTNVHYKPGPGKLVIIPSWVQHYVLPNLTERDRISIAFDVNFTQK